jgi:hypothetical protein
LFESCIVAKKEEPNSISAAVIFIISQSLPIPLPSSALSQK